MQPVKTESIPNHAVLRHLRRDGVAISPTGQTIKTTTTRRLFHVLPTLSCLSPAEFLQSHDESCFRPSGPVRQRSKDRSICDGTQTAHQCTTWRKLSWVSAKYAVFVPSNPDVKRKNIRLWRDKWQEPKTQTSSKHLLKITNPSPFLGRLWRFQGNWTLGSTEALAERPRENLPQTVLVLLAEESKGKMMEDWQERILTRLLSRNEYAFCWGDNKFWCLLELFFWDWFKKNTDIAQLHVSRGGKSPTSGEFFHKLKFDCPKNKNKPELEGLQGEALSYWKLLNI